MKVWDGTKESLLRMILNYAFSIVAFDFLVLNICSRYLRAWMSDMSVNRHQFNRDM